MVTQPFHEKPFTPPASPLTPASLSPTTSAILPISPTSATSSTAPNKDLMSLKIERLQTASWRLTYSPPTDIDSPAQSIILTIDTRLRPPPPFLDMDKIAADLAALQQLHKEEHFTLPNDDPDDEFFLNPALRLKLLQKPPPVPLKLDLLTPQHMDYFLSLISNGLILIPEPEGILSTETIIKQLESRDDFHLNHLLQPLHQHTPHIRFFNSGQAKIEIELLTDNSYGIKFSHKTTPSSSGGSTWNTMCILLAPRGLDVTATKTWCQTLGTNGLKRAENFHWGILDRVEHAFAPKSAKRGVLDMVIMPYAPVVEVQKRGTSFLGIGGMPIKPQSQFPLWGEAHVYTWVVPKEEASITRQGTLEGMLRANGVPVHGSFEMDGVKVVELEEGGDYVARGVPRGMVKTSSLDSMTRDDNPLGSLSMISRVTSFAGLREDEGGRTRGAAD